MLHPAKIIIAFILVVLTSCTATRPQNTGSEKKEKPSALARYVNANDGAYKWEKVCQEELPGGAVAYELNLTSQKWRGITWKHTVYVVRPKKVEKQPSLAVMMVLGGSNRDRKTGKLKEREPGQPRRRHLSNDLKTLAQIANQVGLPIAGVMDIPNQPLFGGLYEDDIIAHTFVKYFETRDETWPLLLPMVKGAVKAMDAVEEFLKRDCDIDISGFVVTGASKRGWTTWLSPVVDKRVKGIAPIVYDNLDLRAQMKHQLDMWGEFSRKIAPYTKRNLPQQLVEKNDWGASLGEIVDPFTFREKLSLPKLILIGTNDDYWPLDALNLYWGKLKGEKHVLYCPNDGHGLRNGMMTAVKSIIAFTLMVDGRLKWPKLEWNFKEKDNLFSLEVNTDVEPLHVRTWVATSDSTDFRESKWKPFGMKKGNLKYTYSYDRKSPEKGCVAILAVATYSVDDDLTYALATNVKIFHSDESRKSAAPAGKN
jgi:PhoPQ-activated pathogenicity-related protein